MDSAKSLIVDRTHPVLVRAVLQKKKKKKKFVSKICFRWVTIIPHLRQQQACLSHVHRVHLFLATNTTSWLIITPSDHELAFGI